MEAVDEAEVVSSMALVLFELGQVCSIVFLMVLYFLMIIFFAYVPLKTSSVRHHFTPFFSAFRYTFYASKNCL